MANNFCQCAPFETCGTCNPEQALKSEKLLKSFMEIRQCRCGTCNPDCLEEVGEKITVMGGTELTPYKAKLALEEAMKVIECVGTTGIHDKYPKAHAWMKKYFPNWAD